MLLVLILALGFNIKKRVRLTDFILILVLNFSMLYSGYQGELEKEKQQPNKNKMLFTNIIGFIFFALMYYFIYSKFLKGYNNFDNKMIYGSFVFLWALYGVAWWLDERTKNVGYNVLDLFSKCFVGIFFWAYFTKVIVL